ncbi:Hypothetical predicted protein, partial [Paramuricea clavata]
AMYSWPDEPFEEMDSTLAVQQYIQQLIKSDFENISLILEPPEGQDLGVWKYEHLRDGDGSTAKRTSLANANELLAKRSC